MEKSNGRYFVRDIKTGRLFCVEAIGPHRTGYGDSLSEHCIGSIREKESIITPENGFINIGTSTSPADYINRLLSK